MGNFTTEQVDAVKSFAEHLKDLAIERSFGSPAAMALIEEALESFFEEPHPAAEQAAAYVAQFSTAARHRFTREESKALKATFLAGFDAASATETEPVAVPEQPAPAGWVSA